MRKLTFYEMMNILRAKVAKILGIEIRKFYSVEKT